MYGLLLIVSGFFLKNIFFVSVGSGLFIDEMAVLMKYGNSFHYKEYLSRYSFIWTFFILILMYTIIVLIKNYEILQH